jgi:hypothetical protein
MSRRPAASRTTRGRWSRDDDPLAVFVRGATVGAFVGAMIAGSAVWHRIRRRVASRSEARQRGLDLASPPRRQPPGPPRPDARPGRP